MGRTLSIALSIALLSSVLVWTGCSRKSCESNKFCEGSSIGCVVTDMDGNITFANPAYRKMLGFSMEELKDRSYQELTPAKWHAIEKAYIEAAKELPFVRFEKEYIRKDGTVIPIEVTGWLVYDENGEPVGTASYVIDTTEYIKDQKLDELILP